MGKAHGVHKGFHACTMVLEFRAQGFCLVCIGHLTWRVSVNRKTAGCLRIFIRIAQVSGLSAEWNSSVWGAYGGQEDENGNSAQSLFEMCVCVCVYVCVQYLYVYIYTRTMTVIIPITTSVLLIIFFVVTTALGIPMGTKADTDRSQCDSLLNTNIIQGLE